MIDKIVDALGGDVQGKTIGILGLAFKPETDDMRDSPTITVIKGLQQRGATIRAYDPQAMENAKTMLENVTYCADAYETVEGADAMVLATEWNEFRALNFERVKHALRQPNVIDLRNVYDPNRMAALGFNYKSVGRVEDRRKRIR
jgi:UDPglucose 6-dehydrogenase